MNKKRPAHRDEPGRLMITAPPPGSGHLVGLLERLFLLPEEVRR